MARIKINIPDKSLAVIVIPVRIGDINYGNHVGNDAFVSILHEARMQWLNLHQYSELDIGGAGLIMSDLTIEFKKEGFYGDVIEVHLHLGEISTAGFELFYQLIAERNNSAVVLANARTGMVCYDYENKKVTAMPGVFKTLLTK